MKGSNQDLKKIVLLGNKTFVPTKKIFRCLIIVHTNTHAHVDNNLLLCTDEVLIVFHHNSSCIIILIKIKT